MTIKPLLLTLTFAMTTPFTAAVAQEASTPNNLVVIDSAQDFDTTVSTIEDGLKDKGMTIFAVIDHAQAAEEAGLALAPTKVIIFGNPKGGTPLMQEAPQLALQLPLKVLVAEDDDGHVHVSLFKADYLAESVGADPELTAPLAKAEALVQKLVSGE